MKKLFAALSFALACAIATPACSQPVPAARPGVVPVQTYTVRPYVPEAAAVTTGPVAQVAPAAAPPAPAVVPTQVPGTSITTSAPVSSDTTISVGTLAGQVLTWIVAAFSLPIGAFLVQIAAKMAAGVGFSLDDARRKRLQDIVVNGLHAAAATVSKTADGKISIDVKSKLLKSVVEYVQQNGGDTLKKLGVDPNSAATEAAIEARAEVALADPSVPISMSEAPATAAPAEASVPLAAVEKMLSDVLKNAGMSASPRPFTAPAS